VNLPEAKFLYGGGSNAITFTMTNSSSGRAPARVQGHGRVSALLHSCVPGQHGHELLPAHVDTNTVRRSYVLATIALDGTNGGETASPGPGWGAKRQIQRKVSDDANAAVTLQLSRLPSSRWRKAGFTTSRARGTQQNKNDPVKDVSTFSMRSLHRYQQRVGHSGRPWASLAERRAAPE